jgi:hypothetical protein
MTLEVRKLAHTAEAVILRALPMKANTHSGSSTNKSDPRRLKNAETTIYTMQTITICGL